MLYLNQLSEDSLRSALQLELQNIQDTWDYRHTYDTIMSSLIEDFQLRDAHGVRRTGEFIYEADYTSDEGDIYMDDPMYPTATYDLELRGIKQCPLFNPAPGSLQWTVNRKIIRNRDDRVLINQCLNQDFDDRSFIFFVPYYINERMASALRAFTSRRFANRHHVHSEAMDVFYPLISSIRQKFVYRRNDDDIVNQSGVDPDYMDLTKPTVYTHEERDAMRKKDYTYINKKRKERREFKLKRIEILERNEAPINVLVNYFRRRIKKERRVKEVKVRPKLEWEIVKSNTMFEPQLSPQLPKPYKFPKLKPDWQYYKGRILKDRVMVGNSSQYLLDKYGKKFPPKTYKELLSKASTFYVNLNYHPPQPPPMLYSEILYPNAIRTPLGVVCSKSALRLQYQVLEKSDKTRAYGMSLIDDDLPSFNRWIKNRNVSWHFSFFPRNDPDIINQAFFTPNYSGGITEFGTSIVLLINTLRGCTGWIACLSSIGQFWLTFKHNTFYDLICGLISDATLGQFRTQPGDELMQESGINFEDWFTKPMGMFLKSDMFQALTKILGAVSIFGMLSTVGIGGSKEQWVSRLEYFERLLWSPRNKGTHNLIGLICDAVILLGEKITLVIKHRDFSYLFGSKMSATEWLKTCAALTDCPEVVGDTFRPAHNKLFQEKLPSGCYGKISKQLTFAAAHEELKILIEALPGIKLAYNDDTSLSIAFAKQMDMNKITMKTFEQRKVNGSQRIQPQAFLFADKPGVGKTAFIDMMHRAVATRFDLPPDDYTKFIYNKTNNFQVCAPTQVSLIFDDIDQDQSGTFNHADIFISMVNGQPYNIDRPSIEEKDKVWLNPVVTMYATNRPFCGLQKLIADPTAFIRRLPYRVSLTPRPAFCTPNTQIIDKMRVPKGTVNLWSVIAIETLDMPNFNYSKPFECLPYKPFKTFTYEKFKERCVHLALQCISNEVWKYQEHSKTDEEVSARCTECGICQHLHADKLMCSPINRDIDLNNYDENGVYRVADLFTGGEILYQSGTERTRSYRGECYNFIAFMMLGLTASIPLRYLGEVFVAFIRALSNKIANFILRSFLNQFVFDFQYSYEKHKIKYKAAAATAAAITMLIMMIQGYRLAYSDKLNNESHILPAAAQTTYKRVPVNYTPLDPNPGYNPESFIKGLQHHMVKLKLNGGIVSGVIVGKGFILTVRHFFCSTSNRTRHGLTLPGGKLTINHKNNTVSVDFKDRLVDVDDSRDLILVWVPEILPLSGVYNLISTTQAGPGVCPSQSFLVHLDKNYQTGEVKATQKRGSETITNHVWEGNFNTEEGDCGSLVVGLFGQRMIIIGMHTAKSATAGFTIAEDIDGSLIKLRMAKSGMKTDVPLLTNERVDVLVESKNELEPLPLKSSLHAAMSNEETNLGVVVLGSNKQHNTRFKTSVVKMPFSDKFEYLNVKYYGSNELFVAPNPTGRLDDKGNWIDPLTVNLGKSTNCPGDSSVWKQAVDDFFDGCENLADLNLIKPMSLFEALSGIPGTVIGGTNLQTSVGPPYNTKKSNHMFVDINGDYMLSPEIQEQLDSIDRIVRIEDKMFSPAAVHSLKDEAISLTKQQDLKIRVFNIMSAAFNIKLKQYFGPISALMRRHPYFFESAIGMDVTSYQWKENYEWLNVNPYWGAADNSDFDVRESTMEWFSVIDFVLRLSKICCYTSEDVRVLNNLLHSCSYLTRNIKGDLFQTTHMMPTGFWLTIFANGIRNSLQRRYAYFRLRPSDCSDTFRESVRQLVLGDDNVMTTNKNWFNQRAIQFVLKEIGAVLTSANKTPEIELFDTPESVTFLKRSFVLRDGYCYAPIEKKTLLRLGQWKVKSKNISAQNQDEIIYQNMLSEAFLHGKEFFEEIAEVVYEICDFKNYKIPRRPFEDYEKLHREDKLSVWMSNFDDLLFESGKEKAASCLNEGRFAPKRLFREQMSTTDNITTPLVGVSAADNTFLVPSVNYTKVVSEDSFLVNHKQPNELFDRDVLIATGPINDTNSLSTNLLGNFDPFQAYLQNEAVTNALLPYKFVKFGMIITVRMITPGACYGLYNLQALCEGGFNDAQSNDSSAFDAYPNSVQDVHGLLDLEARNNVVLELPWEHYLNGIDLQGDKIVRSWRLLLWALSPIRSSLAVTASGTYQIYGRMAKDRQFVNLRYQSKQEKPSSKLRNYSHYASMAASMVPSIAPLAAPAAAGMAAMSSIADAMGFTRESAPKIPDTFVSRQTTSLAPTDGQDRSEIVALTLSNTLSIDPAPGGGDRQDDMAYASLFDRWTIIDVFDIDNTLTEIIKTIAVTPYNCNFQPGFYPTDPGQFYPTTGGWVGAPFKYWRGGMEYMIYIPSSSNLQGSLQILWDPADVPVANYDYDPTHVLSNVVIDLKGTSKTILQVGYSKLEPVAKSVWLYSGLTSSHANGHLRFRITSPLQNPMLTAVFVTVVVMARPMQDMKFGMPGSQYSLRSGPTSTADALMSEFTYQAQQDDEDIHTIVLAPSDPYDTTNIHFGEDIMSVRALVQHFNCIDVVDLEESTNIPLYITHVYPPPTSNREQNPQPWITNANGLPPMTYYSFYLNAFVGVRGSVRYKFITDGRVKVTMAAVDSVLGVNFPYETMNTGDTVPGLGWAVSDLQAGSYTNGAEFTIPSRNIIKYFNPRKVFSVLAPSSVDRVNVMHLNGSGKAIMFMAAGPDTTVTRFRRIPPILMFFNKA